MRGLISLTKRNCLVYFRDRVAVFFSLLSMLIIILLMGLFLGENNISSITNMLNSYGGIRDAAADRLNAKEFMSLWTMSGVLVVNSLTITVTMISRVVYDKESDHLGIFVCAPIKRIYIALAYILSATIAGFFFCTVTFGIWTVYISLTSSHFLSFAAIMKVLALNLLNCFSYSVIMYLIVLFVKTSSAWTAFITIISTIVGFLGAIYLPIGSLPTWMQKVILCLPVFHGTSLMRKVCCEACIDRVFNGTDPVVRKIFNEEMGVNAVWNETEITSLLQVIFIFGCGIIAIGLIAIVMQKKKIADR